MQNNENIDLEYVLYGQYIKYSSLWTLVNAEFSGSKDEVVNVFIDVQQFLLPIFRASTIQDINIISASVINYCAHLRSYFKTRHHVYANIILVYSSNNSNNNIRYYPHYNSYIIDTVCSNTIMSDALNSNIELLNIICKYLPDIYFKIGTVEPSVIIKTIIDDNIFPDVPNIIISSSQFAFQLPANAKNCVVFRKRCTNKEDTTYSYNVFTALQAFIYETRKKVIMNLYNPKFLSTFMALTGLPKRSVKSIYNIKTGLEILTTFPLEYAGDIEAIYNSINNYVSSKKYKTQISYEEFYDRYRAIDIEYQTVLYKTLPEYHESSWLQRLQDPSTVREINNTYFKKHPLNLEWI